MTPAHLDPLQRLRRMRAVATGLLVVMAAVFAVATTIEPYWPAAAYVRAFAEAALVGGCADWFAVTALFRRPLGLPIPHTAVIPRNKARIGAALGRFIVDNFLSPRVIDARLREWEIARWGGAWLAEPANADALAKRIAEALPEVLKALPPSALEDLVGSAALAAVRATPAAPTASALLGAAWDEARVQPLIERGAALLGSYLSEHEEVILEKVQAQSWRWLPDFIDRAVARRITAGLIQLLADVQRPDHPWRLSLGGSVQRLIERLAKDPDLREQGERLKAQVLADPRLSDYTARLRSEFRRYIQGGGLRADPARMQGKIAGMIKALGAWLEANLEVQRSLNLLARALARRTLAPRREAVAAFIARVVEGWDAEDVTTRLERQVGPDLQYIRINGALVGGMIGLILFVSGQLLRALG